MRQNSGYSAFILDGLKLHYQFFTPDVAISVLPYNNQVFFCSFFSQNNIQFKLYRVTYFLS